ncbi:MAG: hypothetical protein JWO28_66 [Hyphomicrobiales bacterium]|nr:hypothetical protein [Hyphomicrobiales bacterium]
MSEEIKAVTETAKAVGEVAKTAGKGIEATRELGGFVARFISGSLDQASGIVEDKLRYYRWERQQRLMLRAEEFMRQQGLPAPTRPVALKFAIPLLEAASMEDDDYLQDMWAKLLVNAGDARSESDIRRAYVDILESITPLEARILEAIYTHDFDFGPTADRRVLKVSTHELPSAAEIATYDAPHDAPPPADDVALGLENLIRLGCLDRTSNWEGIPSILMVQATLLGQAFVRACTL